MTKLLDDMDIPSVKDFKSAPKKVAWAENFGEKEIENFLLAVDRSRNIVSHGCSLERRDLP